MEDAGIPQDLVEGRYEGCGGGLVASEALHWLVDMSETMRKKGWTDVRPMALLNNASGSRVRPCFSPPMMAVKKSSLPS